MAHLVAGANTVVSNDRRLRRQINQLDTPPHAVTADELMTGLLDADPDGIDTVIDTTIAKRSAAPSPATS